MDVNALFYLRDGGPVSPHDERPYPDTLARTVGEERDHFLHTGLPWRRPTDPFRKG